MQKQIIKCALALCGALTLLASCGKDEPVKPNNEILNKLHEDPFGATYTLTEAELSSPEVFDANPTLQHAKPTGAVQTITFALTEEQGWHIAETSPQKAFRVKTTKESPNTVYILGIEYRNAKGEPMNEQFIDNGQDKVHQHFFLYYKGTFAEKDKENLPYDYRYADTTPWNSTMGAYTADKNPIGFKGLIRFSGEKSFALTANLLHANETKYEPDGSTSPFYRISPRLKGASDSDISVKLPIQIGDDAAGGGEGSGSGSDTPAPNPTDDTTLAEGEYGRLNKTQATKMVIKMYEGHLHATADPKVHSYHYVAGPLVPIPNLRMEQELTFIYQDGAWRAAENTTYTVVEDKDEDGDLILKRGAKTLHLDRLFVKGSVTYSDGLPSPIYGCWIEYYDAEGNKLNGEFVTPGAYQHFFTLSNVEPLGVTALEKRQTPDLMDYVYKDTTPWDKSAARQGAKYAEKPLGLKGYFEFVSAGFKGRLGIELRRGGSSESFHTPSGGEPVLRVSIPIYVPYKKDVLETIAELDEDAQWSDLDEGQQSIVELLKTALNASSREEVLKNLLYFYNGERGNERTSGIWF